MFNLQNLRELVKPLMQNTSALKALRFWESIKYVSPYVYDFQYNRERGSQSILDGLESGQPQAIGKLGSVELSAIKKYLRFLNDKNADKLTKDNRFELYNNAGVYPDDYSTYSDYCNYMIKDVLPEITQMGVWFNLEEAKIVKTYAPKARYIPIGALETYHFQKNRWTQYLKDKKVLVIHPFKHSLEAQFENSANLWNEDDILPSFSLKIIQPPFAPSLIEPNNASWFESLSSLKEQMSNTDFDIALIGAGAYSLPLAVHAKKLGKHGIHLGGALQIYFGIFGNRWENNPIINALKNEFWIKPLPEDTPKNNSKIENGCYW
jgi:hypothetical protein